jgi:isopropylmalate/homocitrate/citramalate synthase
MNNLLVFDETLRDGEQQPGIVFSAGEKMELAGLIHDAGASFIDVMPFSSRQDEDIARKLSGKGINIVPATMVHESFVDHSIDCGVKGVILFSPLSDRLLKVRGKSHKENLDDCLRVIRYAEKQGLEVHFAAEDASRAHSDYLSKFVEAATPFLHHFLVCDTVGCLMPEKAHELIGFTKKHADKNCLIGVHFHNDLGLAMENSVQGILAGAQVLSGTFTGIGERAGNADLLRTLAELKREHGMKAKGIDYSLLDGLCTKVRAFAGKGPAKPLTKQAFHHESGIHVSALLKDPLSYCVTRPEHLGLKHEVFFGRGSGTSNFEWLYGKKFSEKDYALMRDKTKELSLKHRKTFTGKEVRKLLKSFKQA